ncbi:hypothetical protein BaRGS_00009564 [Batillaria attramentaria]|uniref:PiggyBac transposable element-derived protein domain-containing protein n=1 Tax=Batillaria attramentaria TaxID=370345 RepID=A0ABD0LIH5_9CAEN
MAARRRFLTVREVYDEIFLDPESDYEPESDEESDEEVENDVTDIDPADNVPSTSTAEPRGRPRSRGRGRGRGRSGSRGERGRGPITTDNNVWTENDHSPERVPFTGNHGIRLNIAAKSEPYTYFEKFVDDELLDMFVRETNRYARQCIEAKGENIAPKSVFALWYPVSRVEMKVFLGLSLNMGLIWKPEIRQYWSTRPAVHTPFFSKCMTRDRFLAILGFFHLVDNEARPENDVDKLYKVRPLLQKLGDRFASA